MLLWTLNHVHMLFSTKVQSSLGLVTRQPANWSEFRESSPFTPSDSTFASTGIHKTAPWTSRHCLDVQQQRRHIRSHLEYKVYLYKKWNVVILPISNPGACFAEDDRASTSRNVIVRHCRCAFSGSLTVVDDYPKRKAQSLARKQSEHSDPTASTTHSHVVHPESTTRPHSYAQPGFQDAMSASIQTLGRDELQD